MSFGDILHGAAKFAKNAVDKGSKAVATKTEEMQHQRKLSDYKRNMLNVLSTGQLKGLAGYYSIDVSESFARYSEGEFAEIISYGPPKKAKKYVPTRDDYINAIRNKVPTTDVIEWCRKNRVYNIEQFVSGREAYMKKYGINEWGIKTDLDLDQPTQPAPSTSYEAPQPPLSTARPESPKWEPSPLVKDVVSRMENMTVTRRFQNELAAHMFLLGKLDEWYPHRVRDEANRKEIDILLDEKIAIEVKNFVEPNPEGEITRLLGQVSRFASRYEAYIVIIFGGSEYHKNEIMRSARSENVIVIIKN